MPFHGIPSKNCSSCRGRRIKCDRLEPICSQCKRAGKPCGGYRDLSSLMFRSENERAAQLSAEAKAKSKARRRLEDGLALDSDSTSESRDPSPKALVRYNRVQTSSSPIVAIPTPLEDQGLRFFINRFVTPMPIRVGGCLQVQNVQDTLFFKEIDYDSSIRDAVVSVGLAAIANVNRDRSLRILSREKHARVIKAVREAVGDPTQANPDRTFPLIVMLSLYEMVSCAPNQLDSWMVHLDGAAALLKQSTFRKFLTASDHRAQLGFYFVSIVKYFSRRDGHPDTLNWSRDHMADAPSELLPAVNLIDILTRFMKYDASLRHENPGPRAIISSALMFEAELHDWEASLPESWDFVVETSGTHARTFYGQYHVHKDAWVSRIYNHYRWARLLFNEIVVSTISRLKQPTSKDAIRRQQSLETISRMSIGICTGAASHEAISQRGLTSENPSPLPPLNGVFMMLFPLAMAGGAAGAPDHVHDWVVGTLEQIGCTMGIQRAFEMIPLLKQSHAKWKQEQRQWEQAHMLL
ncbi:unnamed protein product [Penicillium salamii]|nr:unnamed protein product [Penicillium salamii]CAG8164076.1 unnamed protein product [Penicillium salamii]CAG8429395.1 unnamed protein product [Penicillium salamii]